MAKLTAAELKALAKLARSHGVAGRPGTGTCFAPLVSLGKSYPGVLNQRLAQRMLDGGLIELVGAKGFTRLYANGLKALRAGRMVMPRGLVCPTAKGWTALNRTRS